ncbi:hypothetical protein [Kitasatospora viridis]|uniref:Uncharacterized protein n=1 Tax=Kitasatospora viridis TaxID=281105 RepID=A0A561UJL8_9ACTN|nr:hypothetical protein [Kitasatospora viridis]TWF99563.1 hypothetical protein FHX73_113410 [Kitasatospora viridis]
MSSGNSSDERNPFAPPPQDAPEQPWRPRLPQQPVGQENGGDQDGGAQGTDGETGGGRPPVPPPHPWSPNWQGGGGPGWPTPQGPPPPSFDPTDPSHRRSRYALASGFAAMFTGYYSLQELALLFGALAVYWAISALRAKPAAEQPAAEQPPAAGNGAPPAAPAPWPYAQRSRPQVPAALGGLITGGVALALVIGSFGIQLAYKNYYTCINDALTTQASQSCNTLAPAWLVSATNPQN